MMSLMLLIKRFDTKTDLSLFEPGLPENERFFIFKEALKDNNNGINQEYIRDIMYIYVIIYILKCYYNEGQLLSCFNEAPYQYLLTVIYNGTHQNRSIIECALPSYLDNKELINFTDKDISVALINQTTNCNYILIRRSLNDIVSSLIVEAYEPFNVVDCIYNKTNYPGVVIEYPLLFLVLERSISHGRILMNRFIMLLSLLKSYAEIILINYF